MKFKIFFIVLFAKSVNSCDPEESEVDYIFKAPTYFVHTIHEVVKGSLDIGKLFKAFKYKEYEHELPFVFRSNKFRPADEIQANFSTFKLCGELERPYDVELFLMPENQTGTGILYGCNIETGVDAIMFVYDDETWDAEDKRFHDKFLNMPLSLRSQICECNSAATDYINECLHPGISKKQVLIVFGVVVVAVFVVFYVISNNNRVSPSK